MSSEQLSALLAKIASDAKLLAKVKSIVSQQQLQEFLKDLGLEFSELLPSSVIHSLSLEISESELEMIAGGKPPTKTTFVLGCKGTNRTVIC
jgi:predicted ribosomally synthesized peptide with nif11-like leader